jgi:ribosomal protein S18 acetylase RimI-like enzyme
LLARLEAAPGGRGRLYVAALAVAAPWRRRGVASELLRRSLASVGDDPAVFEAYLHVRVSAGAEVEDGEGEQQQGAPQDDDDDDDDDHRRARRWYAARGFAPAGVVEGYYARLPPPCDALVMRRPLPG